jgi:predicted acylesterase/phospholipase RssA
MKKTLYFQNCLGVFQGGGCRASAYVGAYRAAVERGVNFSEVVGTSAGSIIAVLIAAGSTVEQIEKSIDELDFQKLISEPQPINGIKYSHTLAKVLKKIPLDFFEKYSPIYSHLGIKNSIKIKEWIDAKLKEILNTSQPVKFKDLLIDAHIIVSDLKTKRVEVFNKKNSANKDVAEAVQYSCNIPIFFQPIDLRYVDGGMLSNLGTFVFSTREEKYYNKILAFSLESEYDSVDNKIESFLDYGKSLVNTILDGNLDLQLNLQDNIHLINIKTGNIKATDFDKMTQDIVRVLKTNGKNAVDDFLTNEITNIKKNRYDQNILIDSFQTLNKITQLTEKKYDEIIISSNYNDFVYDVFPTLIRWINDKTKITYIYSEMNLKKNDKPEHFEFRNRFLEKCGVIIQRTDKLTFSGFLFDAHISEICKAIIFSNNNHFHSKYYEGESDFTVINLLHESVKMVKSEQNNPKLVLEKIEEEVLYEKLRKVKQYSNPKIKISLKPLKIEQLTFITQFVRAYKYRQIAYLYELYKNHNVSLFDSSKLVLTNGDFTLVTPPIIEHIGDKMFVIEGNTRLLYAYKNGIKEVNCIVINDIEEGLPSTGRFSIKEVILSDKEVIGEDRYDKFDYSSFRKIESAVRDPKSCLK